MKRILSVGLATVLAMGSCKTVSDSSLKSTEKGFVITQCFGPQGNGGNYASTLGWMAETVKIRAMEAEAIAKEKNMPVFLDFGCMMGGSSGSQSSMIFMGLLENSNLFSTPGVGTLRTPQEASVLADALRFMSITSDLGGLEKLNFYRQVVVETLEGFILSPLSKVDFLKNAARNLFGNKTPTWWDGQNVDGDQILVDFLVTVLLAKTVDKELLYSGDVAGKAAVYLDRFAKMNLIPKSGSEFDKFSNLLSQRSSILNNNADKFIAKQFQLGAYKARYITGPYAPRPALKKVAEAPLGKGICTITTGLFYKDKALVNLDKSPNYKDIRIVASCSKETIDLLLGDPNFINDLKTNPFLKKFVLVQMKNVRGALAVSLREPVLMSELVLHAGDPKFELIGFYDPQIHDRLAIHSFDKQSFGITGGWPDRRISAWLASYVALAKARSRKGQGYAVKGYVSLFGKPDNRSKDKFDTKSIRNIFSSDLTEGNNNIKNWFAFQDSYCETFLPRFNEENIKDETVVFNWDIGSLPAAQSGNGRFLTSLATNATNLQLTPVTRSFVFDSFWDKGFIQGEAVIPCTYDK